jgi:regulator of sigma D
MLESCQTAQERWGGVHLLIDRWLQERHELAAAYGELHLQPTAAALQQFSEVLVDYFSAGHFEVYEQLIQEAEAFGDLRALDLARQIYPRIQIITEAALAFNDQAEHAVTADDPVLREELLHLGKLLQERFELEDCLIDVLHNAHRQAAQRA